MVIKLSIWKLTFVRRKGAHLLVSVVLLCIFLIGRSASIASPLMINPDEAELLATGRLAVEHLLPYERFSTSTSGIWWPIFVGVIGRLGIPLTFQIAHLLSAVMGAFVVICLYLLIQRLISRPSAFAAVLVLALPWSTGFSMIPGVDTSDFTHLSTSMLPLCLISVSAVVSIRFTTHMAGPATSMVLLGLAGFSKYQFVPLSLVMAIVPTIAFVRQGVTTLRAILTSFALYFLPTTSLLIVAYVLISDRAMITEPLLLLADYLQRFGSIGNNQAIIGRPITERISDATWILSPVIAMWLITESIRQSTGAPLEDDTNSGQRSRWLTLFPVSGLAISFMSILVVSRPFGHYNHLLIGGVLVSLSQFLIIALSDSGTHARVKSPPSLWVLALLVTFPFIERIPREISSTLRSVATAFDSSSSHVSVTGLDTFETDRLASDCPTESTVVVWGWSAQMYIYYDWLPGTRYTITPGLIDSASHDLSDINLRQRSTLAEEIQERHPNCIVDAIGLHFFPPEFSRDEHGILQQIPSLEPFIRSNYRELKVQTYDGTGIRYFLRYKQPAQ